MIKLVHEFYVNQGGYLKDIVEFAKYLEQWLVSIGHNFNEIYEYVKQNS